MPFIAARPSIPKPAVCINGLVDGCWVTVICEAGVPVNIPEANCNRSNGSCCCNNRVCRAASVTFCACDCRSAPSCN